MCLIFANTKTVYHIAPKAVGRINGHANSPPLSVITSSPRLDANGIDLMERAPHGKLTTGREARHNMPKRDYRRRVEGGTICDKGHDIWSEQRDCRYASRDSLTQDQCDHCVDGFCEYELEGK